MDISEKQQQEILNKIKNGEVGMSPQVFLLWRDIFWGSVVLIFVTIAVYLGSFVLFVAQMNRLWDLLFFGSVGIKEFFLFFPWLFIFAVLLLAWLAERFAWKYSFAYYIPKLYVALASLALIVVFSFVIFSTPFHLKLYQSAENQNLPVAGYMYSFFGQYRPSNFYVGQIKQIYPDRILVKLDNGSSLSVNVLSNTTVYGNALQEGNFVDIFSRDSASGLDAVYIKQISSDGVAF